MRVFFINVSLNYTEIVVFVLEIIFSWEANNEASIEPDKTPRGTWKKEGKKIAE